MWEESPEIHWDTIGPIIEDIVLTWLTYMHGNGAVHRLKPRNGIVHPISVLNNSDRNKVPYSEREGCRKLSDL